MKNQTNKNSGFSLVELISVVAVMAILAVVAVPIYGSYTEQTAVAVDTTYINECYRASALVVAEDTTDPLEAVAFFPNGTVGVSHKSMDDTISLSDANANEKYTFCGGCSTAIAAIIGGMQEFQSSTLKNETPSAGATFETGMGTLVYVENIRIAGGNEYGGAWVFEPNGRTYNS